MNKFTIHYPNGIKRHVKRAEIVLLGEQAQQISPHDYRVASLQVEQTSGPSYLSGRFIFELKGKKRIELLQSVQGMIRQMQL